MKANLIALLVLFSFISCKKVERPSETINGIWESIGSGWVLQIQDSTQYTLYDVTAISCLPKRQSDLREIIESLKIQNDTLTLRKGVITYKFARTNQIPTTCNQHLIDTQRLDPLFNFEVFAQTVKEHYAFMELNHIDWESLYKKQKAKLNKNTSDIELYQIIEETLEILNDNHAYLEATDDLYDAMEAAHPTEEETLTEQEDQPEIGDFQVASMVVKHHLQEDMTCDSWLVHWGKLNDSIGYIQIKAMWLYADLDIPESLIINKGFVDAYVDTFHKMYEDDYIKKEVEGVSKIMDMVMSDLDATASIVIDIRFNGGGQDAVSFEILSRFISENNLQIATQKLKYKDHFSPVLPLYIKGSTNAYSKPLYVLTSPQTGSAAEAFAIATMAMNNVKRIGAPTAGAMSTALEKTLPIGWAFSISNEIYMDNQGTNYENIGIPVDYNLDYSRDRQTFFRNVANDLDNDKTQILEAIESLNNNNH